MSRPTSLATHTHEKTRLLLSSRVFELWQKLLGQRDYFFSAADGDNAGFGASSFGGAGTSFAGAGAASGAAAGAAGSAQAVAQGSHFGLQPKENSFRFGSFSFGSDQHFF